MSVDCADMTFEFSRQIYGDILNYHFMNNNVFKSLQIKLYRNKNENEIFNIESSWLIFLNKFEFSRQKIQSQQVSRRVKWKDSKLIDVDS